MLVTIKIFGVCLVSMSYKSYDFAFHISHMRCLELEVDVNISILLFVFSNA